MKEKIINRMINDSIEGSQLYCLKDSTWLIFKDKKEWIVNVNNLNGYLWYNHAFFKNIFDYLCLDINEHSGYVRNWVINNLGIEVGDYCHPDYLPGDYDWTDEFDVNEVLDCGTIYSI